jgi:hypothetical protein
MTVTMKVQVSGAGSFSATQKIEPVEAYGKIEVTVPARSNSTPGELLVDVQPGDAGQVQLLFITAGTYSEDLSYTVTGGAADVTLDGPQLLVGSGAVELLGSEQKSLTFSNDTDEAVSVQIVVGRDATPPPAP